MYDDLVKRLWECASGECFNCSQHTETTNASVCSKELMKQAADAIESVEKENRFLKMMQQQMVDKIPMDDIGRMAYATLKGVKA